MTWEWARLNGRINRTAVSTGVGAGAGPGVIAAGLIGAAFGFIVARTDWNLWPVVLAHTLPDTISFIQG